MNEHKFNRAIKILVVEHSPIVAFGLNRLFKAESHKFNVVGSVKSSVAAYELAHNDRPDVLILDGEAEGCIWTLLKQMASSLPTMRTILFASTLDSGQVSEALRFGARGILRKDSSIEVIIRSVLSVMAGEFWLHSENVADLVSAMTHVGENRASSQRASCLTQRERQVVSMVKSGFCNKEIACKLTLSEQTVKHHLNHIFSKLGVTTRLELAMFAVNNRLHDHVPVASNLQVEKIRITSTDAFKKTA
jgi:DNA-binding NarL/FixJ family response regulator